MLHATRTESSLTLCRRPSRASRGLS